MSIKIKKLDDDQYTINGKLVYKDMNSQWRTNEVLTQEEIRVFSQFITAINEEYALKAQ